MGDISVTRSFEPNRNLITEIENKFDANIVSKYSYANDVGGRRVSVIQTGAAFQPVGDMFNLYQYNTRSELTSAERHFGSSTNDTANPVGLQDWSYAYDNIGNRTWTTKANAAASYTANALNQYTERSVPGSSDIIGSAEQDVTITVNEEEADRQGYYWSHRLTVDNLFNPIYTQVVVEAICDPGTNDPFVVSSETGSVFVAASPEEFTYDDDGNLLSDGRFNYSWDAENRLISVETIEGLPADLPIVHVEFAYDYMSRRVGKTVYQWDTGITNWMQIDARSFLYDSWLLVQEQSASGGNVTTNWYVHGLDLSGSLQGAGGIGGLLVAQLGTNSVAYCYDANGNVSELLSTNGTILAHYEYSPFGETIVATGSLADENKFRFSTKYFDDEIGLSYYGYRYYSPSTGKWISDDPLMDPGCPAVMAIKEQVLGTLEAYARIYATVMLDEKLPDEMRILALVELVNTGKAADALMRNEPEFWLSMAGDNWLLFCGNNPVIFVDPFGLDTYLVNREIGGSEVRSKYNPFTHTFVAIQHSDGSISTRGWGTTYNDQKQGLWGTEVQNEWDRLAAAEAIRQGRARRVDGSDLDPYVLDAYEDIAKDLTSFHRWLLWNNCKHEARDLIHRAKRLQKSDASRDNECAD